MAMTKREFLAKVKIYKKLLSQGYPRYADLLDDLDLNLTKDSRVVAYLEPAKSRIVINGGLNVDQISTIVRHEILHHYLRHEKRLVAKVAAERGLDKDNIDDASLDDIKKTIYGNKNFNIAGDYEISNRGYTEEDKRNAREIQLNGQILKGLVTEDDHPEWIDMSLEDMYDELNKQLEQEKDQAQQSQDDGNSDQSGGDSGQQDTDADGQSGDNSDDGGSDSGDSSDDSGEGEAGQQQDSQDASGHSGGNGQQKKIKANVIHGKFVDGKFYTDDGMVIG